MKDFNYRAFGALKNGNYGNGRRIEAGYSHARHNLTSLQVKRQDGSDTIINNAYDYYFTTGTNNGRVQKITDYVDGNYTTTYEYDDFNRLEKAYGNAFYRDYDYDAWGHLTNVSATGGGETGSYTLSYATNGTGAPLNNRINNAYYSYDNAGNLTGDGSASYTYDAASRLKTAGGSSSYEYDGDGNRVKQTNSGGTIRYLWSSVLGEPVVELDSGGGVYRAYVYSAGGQLLALQSYYADFYWVHSDHLGSGRKLTSTNGTVVYRGEYDPHGQMIYEWSSSGEYYKNSHKYTGYERDWATNLDNAKARTFNHNRGRFLQPDPLGVGAADPSNPQSLNRYSYVGNDPANFADPSGLMPSIGCSAEFSFSDCGGGGGFWGGDFGGHVAGYNRAYGGMPANIVAGLMDYEQRLRNTMDALAARNAWNKGDYSVVASILNGNPNVGLAVGGVRLWGAIGAAFATGFGEGSLIASASGIGFGDLLKRGWEGVVKFLKSLREPDFVIISVGSTIGTSRAFARGGDILNPLIGYSLGSGSELSLAFGWILQLATPRTEEIRSWLSGASVTLSGFRKLGGGVIYAPNSNPHWGVIGGFGIGGKGVAGAYAETHSGWVEKLLRGLGIP